MDESETICVHVTLPRRTAETVKTICLKEGLPLEDLLVDALTRAALGLRCDVLRCVTNVGR